MKISIRIKQDRSELFLLMLDRGIAKLEALAAGYSISEQENKRMPVSPAEQAILDRFNAATNAVAQKIRDLVANQAGMDDAEFNTALIGMAEQLEAIAAA